MLRQGTAILLALQLAFAPTIALAQQVRDSAVVSDSTDSPTEPQFIEDVTVFTQPDGTTQKLVNTVIRVENDAQKKMAMEWMRQEMEASYSSGVQTDVVTSALDDERGEQLIAEMNEMIPAPARKDHLVFRLSKSVKNSLVSMLGKIKKAVEFTRDEVRIDSNPVGQFVGSTRAYVNSKVLSAVFFATYLGNPGLSPHMTSPWYIEKLGDSLIGFGPAWQAGISAGLLSYLVTVLMRKSTNKNLISEWLSSAPRGPLTTYFDRALRAVGVKDSKRMSIVNEFSIIKRWAWSDIIFLGAPVSILWAHGYPLATSLTAAAAVFVGSIASGILSQVNLDAYNAKFQELMFLKYDEGTKGRKLSKVTYYLQALVISVTATAAAVSTLGEGKVAGWIATGSLLAVGATINAVISKKLAKAKAEAAAEEAASCDNLLTLPATDLNAEEQYSQQTGT